MAADNTEAVAVTADKLGGCGVRAVHRGQTHSSAKGSLQGYSLKEREREMEWMEESEKEEDKGIDGWVDGGREGGRQRFHWKTGDIKAATIRVESGAVSVAQPS